jgi:hypothetical protein
MNSIESNFVPYQIAVDMKSIGFDEPCMGRYGMNSKKLFLDAKLTFKNSADLYSDIPNDWCNDFTAAPLYQQAFRWFREKHNWHVDIKIDDKSYYFYDCISNKIGKHDRVIQREHSKTYEEAELACLDKLIEICKKK